eukprot:4319879-Amphidinium_carterae.1
MVGITGLTLRTPETYKGFVVFASCQAHAHSFGKAINQQDVQIGDCVLCCVSGLTVSGNYIYLD